MIRNIIILLIMLSALSGCGQKEEERAGISEKEIVREEDNSLEETLAEAETVNERKQIDYENAMIVSEIHEKTYNTWQEAYANYINLVDIPEMGYEYSLIYLDDNDQPELLIDKITSAGGETVVTFHNKELKSLDLNRGGSTYIPESGLIYNNSGHMDYYPVYIFGLYEGDFYQIVQGTYGLLDETLVIRDYSQVELFYEYEWEGMSCTEEEFYNSINEIFPVENGVYADNQYNKAEILSVLKVENHTSQENKEESLIEEFTWKEVYKNHVKNIMEDKEYLLTLHTAISYSEFSELNGEVYFNLKDITQDGIPELWITIDRLSDPNNHSVLWDVCSSDENQKEIISTVPNLVFYYDEEEKIVYAHGGGYAECFTRYFFEYNKFVYQHTLWEEEGFYIDRYDLGLHIPISEQEGREMDAKFEEGKEKYRMGGMLLSIENLEKELDKF